MMRSVRTRDAQAFMSRGWQVFERLRAREHRTLSPLEALALAQTLRSSVRASSPAASLALARRLDFEHLVQLKKTIDRASRAQRR
jgi:hypothetical protein